MNATIPALRYRSMGIQPSHLYRQYAHSFIKYGSYHHRVFQHAAFFHLNLFYEYLFSSVSILIGKNQVFPD